MTEEQYKKTFTYQHNELMIAFYDFLCALFSNWNGVYRQVSQLRTKAIDKAKQDYEECVDE
ncbi:MULTISPECIES: hypothetical protein [unclassified Lysinibacillus]|uniref:hypothetical protein n=1 Tax=unclassified Lysinibacillus TaxID=2636778 RepID=UPI0038295F42